MQRRRSGGSVRLSVRMGGAMNDQYRDSDRARAPGITLRRRQDRAENELVGLCRGLLADGHVSRVEAEFLKDWIERTAEFVGAYPFDRIYSVLSRILADGFIDDDESRDLHDTLSRFVGGEVVDRGAETVSLATSLPLDVPAPILTFEGATFVVSGTFSFGTRTAVHAAIADRGGRTIASVSPRVDFLVIGELGSRDWISSNAGRKIQQAVELRNQLHSIAIVCEEHWRAHL